MKTNRTAKRSVVSILCAIIATSIFVSCSNHQKKESSATEKNINISIFVDLSDRLIQNMTPTQMSRDTAIINYVVDYFIHKSFNAQLLKSKNHLKLFFYPTPQDNRISILSQVLDVNLEKIEPKEKKTRLLHMKEDFNRSLSQIYTTTLKSQNWIGCDIWGFFSSNKVDMCMKKNCRNIMIILTDGYIYAKENIQKEGENKFSYILNQSLNTPNAELISKRKGLNNLEVLVMEVNAKDKVKHEAKMTSMIENWFKSMDVKKVGVVTTDLPGNTTPILEAFLQEE